MSVFPSNTAREAWAEKWCDRCFEPAEADKRLHGKGKGCPIMLHALTFGKKPPAWERNRRATTMDTRFACNAFRAKPEVVRRGKAVDETLPMFEIEPTPTTFVPVQGWPDKAAFAAERIKKAGKGDHA